MHDHDHDPLVRRARLKRTHVIVVESVVREVAARVPASLDRSVLESAGLAALDAAAASYDVDSGVPFASYVRTKVRAALVEVLRSQDWTRPSTRQPARPQDPARVDLVAEALDELPERLAAVVRGFFVEQRSAAELAAELDVTEQRLSQLRAEALVLLRDRVAVAPAPRLGLLSIPA